VVSVLVDGGWRTLREALNSAHYRTMTIPPRHRLLRNPAARRIEASVVSREAILEAANLVVPAANPAWARVIHARVVVRRVVALVKR
jgi:hypothetical protein